MSQAPNTQEPNNNGNNMNAAATPRGIVAAATPRRENRVDEITVKWVVTEDVQKVCERESRNRGYKGFGYAPFHFNSASPEQWKRFIELKDENRDIRSIINLYLRKGEGFKLVRL